jgi:hypothetical protein
VGYGLYVLSNPMPQGVPGQSLISLCLTRPILEALLHPDLVGLHVIKVAIDLGDGGATIRLGGGAATIPLTIDCVEGIGVLSAAGHSDDLYVKPCEGGMKRGIDLGGVRW